MLKKSYQWNRDADFELSLDEIAREGARRMLMHALNQEVEEYIPKS